MAENRDWLYTQLDRKEAAEMIARIERDPAFSAEVEWMRRFLAGTGHCRLADMPRGLRGALERLYSERGVPGIS